jgi:hypothetical protein
LDLVNASVCDGCAVAAGSAVGCGVAGAV